LDFYLGGRIKPDLEKKNKKKELPAFATPFFHLSVSWQTAFLVYEGVFFRCVTFHLVCETAKMR